MIDAKPPLGVVYLAHYGVKGMHWGQRKASAKAAISKRLPTKTTVALGATTATSLLVASGMHKAATIKTGKFVLSGASAVGGLLVKVGAMTAMAIINTTVTAVGTVMNVVKTF